jgi:hypothetical protein
MLTITSVTNIGGGAYTIAFSENVTVVTPGNVEPHLLAYSPSYTEAGAGNITQLTANSITFINILGDGDCTLFFFIAAPTNMTATDAFPIASPLYI